MSRLNENSGKDTVSISNFHIKFDTKVAKESKSTKSPQPHQSKRFKKE